MAVSTRTVWKCLRTILHLPVSTLWIDVCIDSRRSPVSVCLSSLFCGSRFSVLCLSPVNYTKKTVIACLGCQLSFWGTYACRHQTDIYTRNEITSFSVQRSGETLLTDLSDTLSQIVYLIWRKKRTSVKNESLSSVLVKAKKSQRIFFIVFTVYT